MKRFIILSMFALFLFLGSTAFKKEEMKYVEYEMWLRKLPDCKYNELFNPPLPGCTSYAQSTQQNGSYYTHIVNWSCGVYGNYNTYCTDQNPNMPSPPPEQ